MTARPRCARRVLARAALGLVGVLVTLGSAAACGGGAAAAPPGETLPCNVEEVLVRHCQRCHSDPPATGVPFPLVTFANTHATTTLNRAATPGPIWQSMGQVLQDNRMPLDPDTGIPAPMAADDPDRLTILSWVSDGAPARMSNAACGQGSGP